MIRVAVRLSVLALLCWAVTVARAQSNGEIAVLSGNNQINPLHTFGNPLSVTIWNGCFEGCQDGTVTFAVQGSNYASLCNSQAFCFSTTVDLATSGGEADLFWKTQSTAGPFQITATNKGTGHSVTFNLSNTAGPPASITATGGTPQTASTGAAFPSVLKADVLDADGNHTGNGLLVTFTAPPTEPTARFSGSATYQSTVQSTGATSSAVTAGQVGGSYSVTATAPGVPGQAVFSLTNIAPIPHLSCLPTTGPTQVGVAYSATCTASGGTSPYTWSINPGTLPAGVNLNSTTGTSVTVSGSPTSSGSYSYTVKVTDSASQTATQPYSGTIAAGPDLILSKAHVGADFTQGQHGAQYILTVTNVGSSSTSGSISVNDTLPTFLSFASGSGIGWSCGATGQTVTCANVATPIAPGASSTITLNVNVASNAASSLQNVALVVCSCSEDSSNNTSNIDSVTVNAAGTDHCTYALDLGGRRSLHREGQVQLQSPLSSVAPGASLTFLAS